MILSHSLLDDEVDPFIESRRFGRRMQRTAALFVSAHLDGERDLGIPIPSMNELAGVVGLVAILELLCPRS
jgi:hypothetical protein